MLTDYQKKNHPGQMIFKLTGSLKVDWQSKYISLA
jgi:hypothetical protein